MPSKSNKLPKAYSCKHCTAKVTGKQNYWLHLRACIPDAKKLECPLCEFCTEYKHHFEYHTRNHNDYKPFECNQCDYKCVNKSMLNSHLKSHSNFYAYRCGTCVYATKYVHSLKMHLNKYLHEALQMPIRPSLVSRARAAAIDTTAPPTPEQSAAAAAAAAAAAIIAAAGAPDNALQHQLTHQDQNHQQNSKPKFIVPADLAAQISAAFAQFTLQQQQQHQSHQQQQPLSLQTAQQQQQRQEQLATDKQRPASPQPQPQPPTSHAKRGRRKNTKTQPSKVAPNFQHHHPTHSPQELINFQQFLASLHFTLNQNENAGEQVVALDLSSKPSYIN